MPRHQFRLTPSFDRLEGRIALDGDTTMAAPDPNAGPPTIGGYTDPAAQAPTDPNAIAAVIQQLADAEQADLDEQAAYLDPAVLDATMPNSTDAFVPVQ
jgi:hypothetical protein